MSPCGTRNSFCRVAGRGDVAGPRRSIGAARTGLSVDPILSVDGMREALAARKVPFVAVSPLVGGAALKGPLAKLLGELGASCDNRAIAAHYSGMLDHLLIDHSDARDAEGLRELGVSVTVTATVMRTAEDRKGLAREALSAAGIETG
jgi:LPPG:FO 2-phospho-L-lactate transferase